MQLSNFSFKQHSNSRLEVLLMLMKFNRYGYSYNDVDGSSFFEESKDHEGIFTFLASDLTDFPQKLEGYFSKIIDLTTLKLTGYIPSHDDFWNLEE